jgi:hypothetical protein
MDDELFLFDAVTDPIEAHVLGFGPTLFLGVVAVGTFVFLLDGQWRLRLCEFFQSGALAAGVLCIIEACGLFCFSRQCHYTFEDDTGSVDDTIGGDSCVWLIPTAET